MTFEEFSLAEQLGFYLLLMWSVFLLLKVVNFILL
jgi:hypothetical protein